MKIITLGNSLLNEESQAVNDIDKELNEFIKQMFHKMYEGKGIGLAAVQVGRLVRVFITHLPKDKPRVFINPEIVSTSIEENKFEEGCLSLPNLYSEIKRPEFVKIQAMNEKARHFVFEADDLLARVIQHEYDHLNGVLFIDKVTKNKKKQLLKVYQRKNKN
ncbi:MAG: peptide deformylase [Spirochaetales bacterium]|nr:peptide deformylase [Spirochaetales bacterium]